VRLIGSERRRVEHVQEYLHLGPQPAAEYVRTTDQGRRRYVSKYYGKDIDDPLLYHLVINTDRVPYAEAARMIAEAVPTLRDRSKPVSRQMPRAIAVPI
jgi:cytidylate kinase